MASKKRVEQVAPVERAEKLTLAFSENEINRLQAEAAAAEVPLEEFVRVKSLLTQELFKENERKIKQLTETVNRLKVQLSLYTNKPAQGFFLKISKRRKKQMENILKTTFPGMGFEEAVEQAALSYQEDIDFAKEMAEAEAEEKINEEKRKVFEDCQKRVIEKIEQYLKKR